jgi:hypothetical protein
MDHTSDYEPRGLNRELTREITDYLQHKSTGSRELSVLATALRKLAMHEPSCWDSLIERMVNSDNPDCESVSSFLFSIATMNKDSSHIKDSILPKLEGFLRDCLNENEFLQRASLRDISQLCYASSELFTGFKPSRSLFTRATDLLVSIPRRSEELEIADLSSCKELCLLWSTLRIRKSKGEKFPSAFTESLLEASRGLRFCEDLNQNKVGQICDALTVLKLNDPRIVYQVILFVDTHKSEINKKNLLRIIRCMTRLGVDNDILWKRLASRMEDPVGLSFSVQELEEIKRSFACHKNNQRVLGILDLFIKTKIDAQKYGGY